jgi:predicted site-specific integrase-resolvase
MHKKKARSATATTRSGRGRPGARKAARATSSPRLDADAPSKGMLIGYARVSTIDQNLALQRDALTEAGCGKIFTEQLSGAVADRPALREALEFARSGDTLIVWKLGVTQIAHRLGVSPATLYRYIPAARTANAPDV